MASFVHQTCAKIIITTLITLLLSLAPVPGLATSARPNNMLNVINIMEYPEKVLKENKVAENDIKPAEATTKITMWYEGRDPLNFYDKKDWSGAVVGSYPSTIGSSDDRVVLSHQGVALRDPDGSMGAVMYQDSDAQCAWVLAWRTPFGFHTPTKIYVEAGVLDNYVADGSISWDKIREKLESSTTESYYFGQTSDACVFRMASATVIRVPTAYANFS